MKMFSSKLFLFAKTIILIFTITLKTNIGKSNKKSLAIMQGIFVGLCL